MAVSWVLGSVLCLIPPFKTARIEWTVEFPGLPIERFVTEYAGDTIRETSLGDDQGFHHKDYESIVRNLEGTEDSPERFHHNYQGTHYKALIDSYVWLREGDNYLIYRRSNVPPVFPILDAMVTHPDGKYYHKGETREMSDGRIYQKGELIKTLTITHQSFDQPSHRQEPFGLEDIGAQVGSRMRLRDGNNYWWDGVSIVGEEEWLLKRYGLGLEPSLAVLKKRSEMRGISLARLLDLEEKKAQRWRARHPEFVSKETAEEEDEWDIYVRKFVDKNKLSKPKAAVAGKILSRSKKLRDYQRRKSEKGKEAKTEAMEKRIFEKMLVKGLERLK